MLQYMSEHVHANLKSLRIGREIAFVRKVVELDTASLVYNMIDKRRCAALTAKAH